MNQTSRFWSHPATPWIVLAILGSIWGSSFILIKYSLLAFTSDEVGNLRIAISFLALLPLLIARRKHLPWRLLPIFFVVGMCGNFMPSILYSIAETKIDSGIAGVLTSLTPMFTIIIAWLFFTHKFKLLQAMGIVLGFCGASLLVLFSRGGVDMTHIRYGLLVVLATVMYGTSVNVVKNYLGDIKPIDITLMSFASVGLFALGYVFCFSDFVEHATTHPDRFTSLTTVTFLALVGTVLSTIVFYKLVQETDAIFSSLVAYIIPIVAMLWAFADGENVLPIHLAGFGLILFGVYLVKRK